MEEQNLAQNPNLFPQPVVQPAPQQPPRPKLKLSKWIVAAIVVIILILGICGYFLYQKQSKKPEVIPQQIHSTSSVSPTIKNTDTCNSQNYYTTFLQHGFGNSVNLQRDTDPKLSVNQGIGSVEWKRKTDEPYIIYPAKTLLVAKINNQKVENINRTYKSLVDNKFSEIGFVVDPLNTVTFTYPDDNSQWYYRYGYRNGNTLIIVSIDKYESSQDQTAINTSVSFSCGVINPTYDALYTDLLSSTAVSDALRAAYGKNGLQNIIFSIWGIHQNSIVTTDIGSHDYFAGHGAWFHKENNNWSEIYEGQNLPNCSMLEKFHIEPGVSCIDLNSPQPENGKTH